MSLLQEPRLRRPLASLGKVAPGAPSVAAADSLFGPRGVCELANGDVWIADTGHHRVLRWRPGAAAADLWLGQASASGDAANGGGERHAASLQMPVGVCAFAGQGLAVADSWNHRVLIWHEAPRRPDQAADLILGQGSATAGDANQGAPQPTASSLFWPSGLWSDGRRFAVADTGNRRLLVWQALPERSGQPADQVLGQPGMGSRDQNAGRDLDASGMVWPHALACWRGDLVLADAGANRIMRWQGWPSSDGAPCATVLGQVAPQARLHNRGRPVPDAACLAMPYGLAVGADQLLVADTANSRLLVWSRPDRAQADGLHGQADFSQAGDNRWQPPTEDSLCWPYGLASAGDRLLIADTGNNRVQLWSLPELTDAH